MKCTECPCYIQYDTYDLYNNLMEKGSCQMAYIDCYNDKTREFEPCKDVQCTFKVKGFING